MKKQCVYSFLTLVIIGLVACKKDKAPEPHLSIEKSEWEMPGYLQAVERVKVTSNRQWNIDIDSTITWLKVDFEFGSGFITIVLTNKEVYDGTPRKTKMVITSVDGELAPVSLTVTQKPFVTTQSSVMYQGPYDDVFTGSTPTADGGVIVVGYSDDFSNLNGLEGLIARYSSTGQLLWKQLVGGKGAQTLLRVIPTTDGKYVALGSGQKLSGPMDGGNYDAFLVRFDEAGTIAWTRYFGGSEGENGLGLVSLPDGISMVAATSVSKDGDVGTPWLVGPRTWLFTVDKDGKLLQGRTLEKTNESITVMNMVSAMDGSVLLAGKKQVAEANFAHQPWLANFTQAGAILWERTFDGAVVSQDMQYMPMLADKNGALFAYKYHNLQTNIYVARMIKTNSVGKVDWENSFNLGLSNSEITAFATDPRGGYFTLGYFERIWMPGVQNLGQYDGLLMNLDARGQIRWGKSLGGSLSDVTCTMSNTTDGHLAIGGASASEDGDLTGKRQKGDAWLIKLSF